jgi:ATP-dependent Lon protease
MTTLNQFPLLPLRDVVVYPHMVIPLFVGREKSIEALEVAMAGSRTKKQAASQTAIQSGVTARAEGVEKL